MAGRGLDRKTVILPGIKSTIDIHDYVEVNGTANKTLLIDCRSDAESEAVILLVLAGLGIMANLVLMVLIVVRGKLRRWNQGLLFHQAFVDLVRSFLLIPLGMSILGCSPIGSCSVLETSFLLLVTASTINLLTTVMSDVPVLPDEDDEDAISMLMDSPQCVGFGIFVIWFASITINLGPTFLSGTMAANINQRPTEPSCPLVQGPYRHYILNFLWIFINIVCIILTIYHLIKLYRDYSNTSAEAVRVATLVTSMVATESDSSEINEALDDKIVPGESLSDGLNELRVLTADPLRVKMYLNKMEREGIDRVKMFLVITIAYLIFWGPLFLVTLVNWDWNFEEAKQSMAHEVTLHVAFVHSFVNPSLLMVLHKGIRQATCDLICCSWRSFCHPDGVWRSHPTRMSGQPVLSQENRAFLNKRSIKGKRVAASSEEEI